MHSTNEEYIAKHVYGKFVAHLRESRSSVALYIAFFKADAASFVMDTDFFRHLESVRGPQPYRPAVATCETFTPSNS